MKLVRLSVAAAVLLGSSLAQAAYLDLTQFESSIPGAFIVKQPNLAVINVIETMDGGTQTNLAVFGSTFVDNLVSFDYSLDGVYLYAKISGPDIFSGGLLPTNGSFMTVNLVTPYSGPIQFSLLDGFGSGATLALRNLEGGSPVTLPAVPEPETYAMLLAGLGLMGAIARRKCANGRRRRSAAALPGVVPA